MTDHEFETELRAALHRVADAVPVDDVAPRSPLPGNDPGDRAHPPWVLLGAAAALVAVLVAIGVFVLLRDGDDVQQVATEDAGADEGGDEEVGQDADQGTAAETDGAGADLDGAYLLVSGTIDGADVPIEQGNEPTLVVEGSEWGGRAACNGYGGRATVDADGTVTIGELAKDDMACEEPLMAAEASYLSALGRVDRSSLDGDALTLTGNGVELVFTSVPAPEETGAVFTDVDWRLESIIEDDTARSSTEDRWGTLRLGDDGSLHATGPCVVLSGEYQFGGVEITPTSLSAEYPGCEPDSDDNAIISIVEGSRPEVTDGGDRLTLSQGSDQLVYRRADQPEPQVSRLEGDEAVPGVEVLVAVTDDLDLVHVIAGEDAAPTVVGNLRDAVPGVVGVDGIAHDGTDGITFVGALRGTDGGRCDGAIVVVDPTGAGRHVVDGITPVLSPDHTRLAYGLTEIVDGACHVTAIGVRDLTTGASTETDIDDVPRAGAERWSLASWPDPDGCCTTQLALSAIFGADGTPAEIESLAETAASLRLVDDAVVVVDESGELLVHSPDRGVVRIDRGYVAADGFNTTDAEPSPDPEHSPDDEAGAG